MKKISRKERKTVLEGKRVILRPLTAKDINKRYLSWLNDRLVTRYMESGRARMTLKDLRDFCDRIKKSDTDIIFAIIDRNTKKHIGNIKLGGIKWNHRYGNLGIMIGEKDYWGKGCGREACRLLVKYAFKNLGLNKVTLGVHAFHQQAVRSYIAAGFRIEGRLKKMLKFNGRYVDKIIMGINNKGTRR